MKKIFTIIVSLILCMAVLTACGGFGGRKIFGKYRIFRKRARNIYDYPCIRIEVERR